MAKLPRARLSGRTLAAAAAATASVAFTAGRAGRFEGLYVTLIIQNLSTYTNINIKALCAAPPEALAHSPSQMPLSCPVAPASQRELHKDGGGGGDMAGRARAARAPKAKSCATSCGTSSVTSCATSFTCSSFMCYLRAGVGGGSHPGRCAPQHTFFAPLKGCVLYMLALH